MSALELTYASGDTVSIVYEQSKSLSERFSLNGKPYELAAGRVFLVDPTQRPPSIAQVPADVREIVPGQKWHQGQRAAPNKAVEKLRDSYPAVREFLSERP